MLTREENESLTRVGPGTPAGELLRRYWHPVAVAQELTDEQPTKFVRILGEDLVLFKDKSGNVGLIQDHCVHRGASLLYGRVEERGIACAYHGWLYDTAGNCLETPGRAGGQQVLPHGARSRRTRSQSSSACTGPTSGRCPRPGSRSYDVWARKDGVRKIDVYPRLDCNWLQAMENSVDPAHLQILHQDIGAACRRTPNTTRGFTDDVEGFDFYEVPFGIIKKPHLQERPRRRASADLPEHPARRRTRTQIRVPDDDTHTNIFFVRFVGAGPRADGTHRRRPSEDHEVTYIEPVQDARRRAAPDHAHSAWT